MKQFKDKEEFNKWISENFNHPIEEQIYGYDEEQEIKDIVSMLEAEGYDLDNLVADGHAYEIGGHTNNGWLYRDEADIAYIEATGRKVELRDRN